MRVHTIEGVDLIHINEFCELTHRLPTSCRGLIEKGNAARKLKSYRVRSQLYIPVAEITGFPFTKNNKVFHYRLNGETYERYLCETCSFTPGMCEPAQKAFNLNVPKGDD